MAAEPKLVVALEARLNKFEKTLKDAGVIADKKVSEIENRFSRMNPKAGGFLDSFNRNLLAAAVSGIALDQVMGRIRQSVKEVDDLGDFAERVGISTDTIQTLRHTLGQAGGEAEAAEPALNKFADAVAEAGTKTNEMTRLFNANGIALRDSNGQLRTTQELLVDYARLVDGTSAPQEKLRLTIDAFGKRSGPQMVGTLEQIARVGLPAMTDSAKAAGVVIDKSLIDKAGELDKAFRKIEERSATAFKKMAVDWGGPFLLDAFKGLETSVKMFALSFDLLTSGRIREAIGLVNRFEAAKQRMTVGVGTELTPDLASSFYDAVGIPKPTATGAAGPKTKIPGAASQDEFQKALEAARKQIELSKVEADSINLGTAARERAKLQIDLETAAKAANTAAGFQNNAVTASQSAAIEKVLVSYEAARLKLEQLNGALPTFAREAADTNKQLQDAAVGGLRGFEDGLIGVIQGTQTAQEAFHNMANAIIADLIRIAVRQAITGPLAAGLGSLFGGGAGVLPGGSALGFGGIGHNAAGTDNWRGGLTWVGERGKELVNLPKGSQVIPNHRIGDMMPSAARAAPAQRNISVTIVNSPTFAPGMTGADVAAMQSMMQQNSSQLRQQVQEDLRTAIRNDADTLTRG